VLVNVGARAVAQLSPVADGGVDTDEAIVGEVIFSATAESIDLQVKLHGCIARQPYFFQISEASSCANPRDASWDGPRGEGMRPFACTVSTAGGPYYAKRAYSDAKPWSIGGAPGTDLIGHAFYVLDLATRQPRACGVIGASAPLAAAMSATPAYPLDVRAAIGGLCIHKLFVRVPMAKPCPDPAALAECAATHCGLDRCLAECKDYIPCLQANNNLCDPTCEANEACVECRGASFNCTSDLCAEITSCVTPPTPGGPCTKLHACCDTQRSRVKECHATVGVIEKLSGDPSCMGAMMDWDYLTNGPNDPPCTF
jgi:hypothetical protein